MRPGYGVSVVAIRPELGWMRQGGGGERMSLLRFVACVPTPGTGTREKSVLTLWEGGYSRHVGAEQGDPAARAGRIPPDRPGLAAETGVFRRS